ncbi:nucleotidyltransferase substrate binding protein [bacterium]|nr:MAG: nucleotidyltransferase substrate binding protein [bacterium]
MEIVGVKYQAICNALNKLKTILEKLHSHQFEALHEEMRDSAIKRFEFCMDTFWKFLKVYLTEVLKIQPEKASPRHIFYLCLQQQLISNEELVVLEDLVGDRNLTSHTYNEELAESISENIPKYYHTMSKIIARFKIERI